MLRCPVVFFSPFFGPLFCYGGFFCEGPMVVASLLALLAEPKVRRDRALRRMAGAQQERMHHRQRAEKSRVRVDSLALLRHGGSPAVPCAPLP